MLVLGSAMLYFILAIPESEIIPNSTPYSALSFLIYPLSHVQSGFGLGEQMMSEGPV
jgi:hypothetical protein